MGKSWDEKLLTSKPPRVEVVEKAFWGMIPGDRMLISSPKEIDALIREIPLGETRTVTQMKQTLADRHRAKITCPLTMGIFLRIVCEAAQARIEAGEPIDSVTPFWRAIEPKSALRKKFSFDPSVIDQHLAREQS